MSIKKHLKRDGFRIVTPTMPLVRYWWARINVELWDGYLPPPATIEIKQDRKFWGWTHTNYAGKYDLDIDSYPLTKKRLIEVLVHESVHAYLWVAHGDNKTVHGPAFMAHRHKVRRVTGLKLSKEISI
jgi:hypothetical protein